MSTHSTVRVFLREQDVMSISKMKRLCVTDYGYNHSLKSGPLVLEFLLLHINQETRSM